MTVKANGLRPPRLPFDLHIKFSIQTKENNYHICMTLKMKQEFVYAVFLNNKLTNIPTYINSL